MDKELKENVKILKLILIVIISFIISALIFFPCMLLSLISRFKIDYHHKFHLWWYEEVLSKYE
jgi:hypothetical protein